jgi:hypothetical protein
MKICTSKAILTVFSILLFSTISFSQTIGKIYPKEEANVLFGNIIEFVSINPSELISILNQTENYCMFQVQNKKLIILGDGRKVLYPTGTIVSSNEIFALFSKSKVMELLGSGSGTIITVERRESYLTVTFGLLTLELAVWCPPFCPN